MDLFERIAGILLPVLFIVLLGYLYGRRHKPDLQVVNQLSINVLAPALVFSALASKDFDLLATRWLLLGGLVVVLGSGLIAWIVARLLRIDVRTFIPPMMFNNCGNMGLPLAVLAFGPTGLAPAVAMFIVSNALHFTVGTAIVSGKVNWRAAFLSPVILATVAGCIVSLLHWPVPRFVQLPMEMLGQAAIPLMLFALGNRMTAVSSKGWHVGVLGAVVCPVAGLLAAWPLVMLLPLSDMERGLLFLFAALPPAVLNYMVAEQYQQQPELVASIVLIGNIAALLFVPLGLYLAL
jgi:predicted permease